MTDGIEREERNVGEAWDALVEEESEHKTDLLDVLYAVAAGSRALEEVYPLWLQNVNGLRTTLDYDTAVGIAQQSKTGEDVTHWIVGDMAVAMMDGADHGTKMELLNKFAGDTGYSQAEMREMHGTSKFWPPHVRKALMDEDEENILSWSHFNRARRGLELEEAKEQIASAIAWNWSVAELEEEIQSSRSSNTPEEKKRNKIKMAIQALGYLSGIGLPEDIVRDAKTLRHKLEDEL